MTDWLRVWKRDRRERRKKKKGRGRVWRGAFPSSYLATLTTMFWFISLQFWRGAAVMDIKVRYWSHLFLLCLQNFCFILIFFVFSFRFHTSQLNLLCSPFFFLHLFDSILGSIVFSSSYSVSSISFSLPQLTQVLIEPTRPLLLPTNTDSIF